MFGKIYGVRKVWWIYDHNWNHCLTNGIPNHKSNKRIQINCWYYLFGVGVFGIHVKSANPKPCFVWWTKQTGQYLPINMKVRVLSSLLIFTCVEYNFNCFRWIIDAHRFDVCGKFVSCILVYAIHGVSKTTSQSLYGNPAATYIRKDARPMWRNVYQF